MKKGKAKTRARAGGGKDSSLGKVPRTMAALARAQRVTEQASGCGFDWPTVEPVWDKIEEELRELKAAVASGGKGRAREEMGDLLFSLVNLSRFLGVEAEAALGEGVDRFLKRFSHIETRLRQRGKSPAESSLEEMDALWEEAKRMERRP
ncbi:MAG: hypothetical protein HYY47_09055 [Deltaproteobacteria bacterium]|nr:hypothetical protein [Deltaproteobacteria bacterium]